MSAVGPGGADWDDIYLGDGTDTEPFDHQLLADALDREPGRVLDLGCGGGGNAIGLARRGWTATGLDSSPKAISSARISAANAGVQVRFLLEDMTTWMPDAAYDLVLSLFALPPRGAVRTALLSRCKLALAPGGMLIVGEWERMDGHREPYVTPGELTEALWGLDILRVESVNADPELDDRCSGLRHWRAVLATARLRA